MPLRVSAYIALHYGQEYLGYAIRSLYDQVEKIFLVYTKEPSRGERSKLPNPDSLGDLARAVNAVPDPQRKIEWHVGSWWGQEQYHREFGRELVFEVAQADVCLSFDCDEVFHPESLRQALALAAESDANIFRLNFVHLWRSFNWVCTDEMMPVRLQKREGEGEAYLRLDKPIYHLGYAQRPELVRYKMPIHGHRAEFRQPPQQWWEQKFVAWAPGAGVQDVHPTAVDIWNPEPFDRDELPEIMREHPYWDKEIID